MVIQGEYYKKIRVGPPRLTKYERARLVGARALQLMLGAPPLVDVMELKRRGIILKDTIEIAEYELNEGLLPVTIIRRAPGGKVQAIPLEWLLKAEREVYE